MKRKVPFGVGILGDRDPRELVEGACSAEALGFDTCWIAEDYFCGGAFSIASICAARTKSLNLAIGVVNPYSRHPGLIAMEAAALSNLSNGRLRLGIGASNRIWIESQLGIPFEKPLASIQECIQILRMMFAGQRTDFAGQQYHLSNVNPRFPACASLPILLGAKSEGLLRLAGRAADGVLLSVGTSAAYVRWAKEQILEGAREAGRELREYTIAAYLIFSVDQDREKARARVKERLAYYVGLHGDHPITRHAGIQPQLIPQFREGFLAGNYRTDLVSEEMIDTLSISGTPEECRRKLQVMMDAGLTQPVMFQIPEIPLMENMRQVKRYLMDEE